MGADAYLGSGVLPAGKDFKWGAEFASAYSEYTGGPDDNKFGNELTPIVHDLTLTYLLPAPVQLERRVIDF